MTASGSSTADHAAGDRVTAGRVTPERAVAVSAMRGVSGKRATIASSCR